MSTDVLRCWSTSQNSAVSLPAPSNRWFFESPDTSNTKGPLLYKFLESVKSLYPVRTQVIKSDLFPHVPGSQNNDPRPCRSRHHSAAVMLVFYLRVCAEKTTQNVFQVSELAQLETPIARYKPGQKEKSRNNCCFQHIDHLFLGHHHHITGTPSQNDQGTIKT